MIRTHQDISAGDGRKFQVLDSTLLQLHIRVADLAVAAQHLLDGGLGLREQVDELDVGRQQQGAGRHRAQVELGVEKVELDQGAGSKDATVTKHRFNRQQSPCS